MSSDRDYPRIFAVNGSRLYALFWAAIFFIAVNIVVFLAFGKDIPFKRFHYYTSYEEVSDEIELVRQETRPTVVFVGGSVLWGAGTRDADKTVPAEFARLTGSGVAVYNLAMVAARPVDEYLLMYLLKDSADLVIGDYNYEFGLPINRNRLISDRSTYVRMGQLYDTYGPDMLRDIPAMASCLTDRGLPVPGHDNWVENRVRLFAERHIPVFIYKDRINNLLFGQHPLTLIERVPLLLAQRIRGGEALSLNLILDLFKAPEDIIKEETWKPGNTPVDEHLPSLVFDPNDLQSCLGRAWSAYAHTSAGSYVMYLLPNNPMMFPGMHASEIHMHNVMQLRTIFDGIPFYNFDNGTMTSDLFTDSTHLTASGSIVFARRLYDSLKADDRLPSVD